MPCSSQHEFNWTFPGFVGMDKIHPCACRKARHARSTHPTWILPHPLWIWEMIPGTSGSAALLQELRNVPAPVLLRCAAAAGWRCQGCGDPESSSMAGFKASRTCWCHHQAGLKATLYPKYCPSYPKTLMEQHCQLFSQPGSSQTAI